MTEIDLPFSTEMAIAALDGRKIATTLAEKKGEIGDVFLVKAPDFRRACCRIIDIQCRPLWRIRNAYYRIEGFNTPREFQETWEALHHGHFLAETNYYVHFFGRVS